MSAASPVSRRKLAAFRLVSMLLGLAAALTVSELVLARVDRRAEARRLYGEPLQLMRANPHGTGSFRLAPNLDRVARLKGVAVAVHTNSHGMRWHEVSLEKPKGRRRVAILGDSFAFGCWSDSIETSFAGVLEEKLNKKRFEVLDFGVGGYGVDDMELQLREDVLAFAPDDVIVTVFSGNDFRDTWLGVDKYDLKDGGVELNQERLAARVPAAFLKQDDTVSPPARDPDTVRRVLSRLRTFDRLYGLFGAQNPWLEFSVSRRFTMFTFWSQLPQPPFILQARDALLEKLESVRALGRSAGFNVGVVSIPFRDQVYAAQPATAAYDIDFPQAYLKVWAREQQVPFLDLLPPLRERVLRSGENLYLAADIHFDTRGHRAAGEEIHRWYLAQMRPLAIPGTPASPVR